MVDITNFLAPIQDLLGSVEKVMEAQADDRHPDLSKALSHLLASGGKRIRPAVALLVGEMLGADRDKLITLSAAIELLHTATLVHDDLIDGALLRRGIATLNSQWTPAATVLTGDFVFARAAKLAAKTDSVEVMQLFAETLAIIVNGEIAQLFDRQKQLNQIQYEQRIYAKTASMFELSAAAAALLSPVNAFTIETMRLFGKNLGMAFQIVDDILDYTGESTTVGKPVGNDLRLGLITLPALLYHNDHPDDPSIMVAIQDNGISDAELDGLIDRIRKSRAIDDSFEIANRFIKESEKELVGFPDSEYKKSLVEIMDYIVKRRL